MSETLLPIGQEQINEEAIEQYAKDDGALSFKLEIFEGPLAMELGEYGADSDDYEIKIPKGVLENIYK